MHLYFSISWLSFTSHFLNPLQRVIIIFLRRFDYPKSLIDSTSLVQTSSDNRGSTLFFFYLKRISQGRS